MNIDTNGTIYFNLPVQFNSTFNVSSLTVADLTVTNDLWLNAADGNLSAAYITASSRFTLPIGAEF
jgi:hypothetical protein